MRDSCLGFSLGISSVLVLGCSPLKPAKCCFHFAGWLVGLKTLVLCAMLCYAMLCYAALYYVVLCYPALCYAMLQDAALCCAMVNGLGFSV